MQPAVACPISERPLLEKESAAFFISGDMSREIPVRVAK